MSRAVSLVKFNDGTILIGCYSGASDLLRSWLITEEELNKKYDGYVFDWDDFMYENHDKSNNQINLEGKDIEDVEIFSDYGDGFCWNGKASKNEQVVVEGRDPYEDEVIWSDDIPDWVIDYFNTKGWDTQRLVR